MDLHLPLQGRDLGVEHGQHGDQRLDGGGVGVGHDLGLAQMLGAQRGLDRGRLLRDVAAASALERGVDLRKRQPGGLRRDRGFGQQLQGVGGVEVLERDQRGREVVPQGVAQPLGVPGAFPDQGFVGAGHDLDRLGLGGVARDGAQLVGVGADHVGRHVCVTGVAFGPGDPQPAPEFRCLQRIDRHHRVAGRDQRRDPGAPVGLDPDHHLHVLVGFLADLVADHRVQPGHADHALGRPRFGQPPPRGVHQLDVVMVLGPVITHEQSQRSSRSRTRSPCRSPTCSQRENSQRPNQAVLTPPAGGHDIPAAINSPGLPAGALSFVRTRSPGGKSAHLPAGYHQEFAGWLTPRTD